MIQTRMHTHTRMDAHTAYLGELQTPGAAPPKLPDKSSVGAVRFGLLCPHQCNILILELVHPACTLDGLLSNSNASLAEGIHRNNIGNQFNTSTSVCVCACTRVCQLCAYTFLCTFDVCCRWSGLWV